MEFTAKKGGINPCIVLIYWSRYSCVHITLEASKCLTPQFPVTPMMYNKYTVHVHIHLHSSLALLQHAMNFAKLNGSMYWFMHAVMFMCLFSRSRSGEPIRRGIHQWTSTSQSHPAPDHRNGIARRPSMRHQPHSPCLPWLCFEDPTKIPGEDSVHITQIPMKPDGVRIIGTVAQVVRLGML